MYDSVFTPRESRINFSRAWNGLATRNNFDFSDFFRFIFPHWGHFLIFSCCDWRKHVSQQSALRKGHALFGDSSIPCDPHLVIEYRADI